MLILDEIQSGMGRTGALFSYMQKGVVPDILTSAKGLGGGFPVGAMLTTTDIASVFSVGVHGTTYGGNPLACAVAGAVFDVINTIEVLDGVKARHALFMEGLKAINARRRVFADLRGEGVWLGCRARRAMEGKGDGRHAGRRRRGPRGPGRGSRRRADRAVAGDQSRRDPRGTRAARSRAQSRAGRSGPPMFYVRPIARDDLPAVLSLSERTGHGLTTLPANRERLSSRIDRSLASFAGTADARRRVLRVRAGRRGDRAAWSASAAIEAAVGLAEPWYNYRVGTLVHASRALDVYTAAPTLFLANDHTGHTELCSLFLDQGYRHAKNGPLLAKSRLLFIAEFADRFAPKVIAELRGRLDADGRSPFWEGLGRHFFAMEYTTADYLTGIGQKSFVAELMPRHPVYVNLLPRSARAVIGEVHADTQPARAMLEQEGFRYEGYVDIFDAGPTLECFRDNVHAVRASRLLPVSSAKATRCRTPSRTTSCGW